MKASIIIPCYNEEKNVPALVERFARMALPDGVSLELVLVDNGSRDKTGAVIEALALQYDFIRPVVVPENQGYGYGILTGLRAATGEVLGWMHADLQSDPDVFADMFRRALTERGAFLYKGRRTHRPVVDTFFTIGMSLMETLYLGMGLWDINAQPTLLPASFFRTWENPPSDFSLDLYVYAMAKKKGVPVHRFTSRQYARKNGVSSWNTGMAARWRLIRRVWAYSREMRKVLKHV